MEYVFNGKELISGLYGQMNKLKQVVPWKLKCDQVPLRMEHTESCTFSIETRYNQTDY